MVNHSALEDLVVLDLTRVVAGPYCGSVLADMGAQVIKIERPGRGDDARAFAPHVNGESTYYANLNRNKRGLTLNLKTPEGQKILKDLAARADILIENFRPGVMDRLGLGYDTLKSINERLIYGAVSGFGSYGRYSQRPGYDIISQAMGGLMSLTGAKGSGPTRSGNAMGDILGGLNLTIGVLAAVHARTLTGKGQRVDVALVDSVVASLENAFARFFDDGKIPERMGNSYAAIAPYDSYRASDGEVVIACGNQRLYEILCNELLKAPELIEDERFLTVPLRSKNSGLLKEYIERWTMSRTVDDIVEACLQRSIPASPIMNLQQIVNDPHIAGDREMFVELTHPVIGKMKVNGNPIKLLGTPVEISCPAPFLGEHTDEILSSILSYDKETLADLRERNVI